MELAGFGKVLAANSKVEIVNYCGTVEKGDLILDGTCAVCGHAVARVVETSQTSHEHN